MIRNDPPCLCCGPAAGGRTLATAQAQRGAPKFRRSSRSPPATAWWWRRKRSPPRDRPRHAAARRQRGRCRGRDRLCAGGDLSARRQHRRRRLHGDPSRQGQARHRHRLSRDRAGRDHARTSSSTRRARPIRKSRASSGLAIGVPGTVAGLALAHSKYGSGKFTLAQLIAPAIALARDGIPVATTSPTRCR